MGCAELTTACAARYQVRRGQVGAASVLLAQVRRLLAGSLDRAGCRFRRGSSCFCVVEGQWLREVKIPAGRWAGRQDGHHDETAGILLVQRITRSRKGAAQNHRKFRRRIRLPGKRLTAR